MASSMNMSNVVLSIPMPVCEDVKASSRESTPSTACDSMSMSSSMISQLLVRQSVSLVLEKERESENLSGISRETMLAIRDSVAVTEKPSTALKMQWYEKKAILSIPNRLRRQASNERFSADTWRSSPSTASPAVSEMWSPSPVASSTSSNNSTGNQTAIDAALATLLAFPEAQKQLAEKLGVDLDTLKGGLERQSQALPEGPSVRPSGALLDTPSMGRSAENRTMPWAFSPAERQTSRSDANDWRQPSVKVSSPASSTDGEKETSWRSSSSGETKDWRSSTSEMNYWRSSNSGEAKDWRSSTSETNYWRSSNSGEMNYWRSSESGEAKDWRSSSSGEMKNWRPSASLIAPKKSVPKKLKPRTATLDTASLCKDLDAIVEEDQRKKEELDEKIESAGPVWRMISSSSFLGDSIEEEETSSSDESVSKTQIVEVKNGVKFVEFTDAAEIKAEKIYVPKNRALKRSKFTCLLFLPTEIAEDKAFRPTSYIIGKGGENMKAIHERTQSKLRMRGIGSNFKEVNDKEGNFALHLCLGCDTAEQLEQTKAMCAPLFSRMFDAYCKRNRSVKKSDLAIRVTNH